MNRELVVPGGAGIYPLQGDVTSTAGNNNVKVTGFEGIPLTPGPYSSGVTWQYVSSTNQWVAVLRAAIQVDGVTVSDDYNVSVDVLRPVRTNGS